MDEAGVSHGVKQREAAPQSVEDSNVDSNAEIPKVASDHLGPQPLCRKSVFAIMPG